MPKNSGTGSSSAKNQKRTSISRQTNKLTSFLKQHDPFQKHMKPEKDEGREIQRIADMRVSTAVVIKRTKNRDSFTRRILDDSNHDSKIARDGKGSQILLSKIKSSPFAFSGSDKIKDDIIEELSFEDLAEQSIELTQQPSKKSLKEPHTNKAVASKLNFEDFYSGYTGAASSRLQSEAQKAQD